MSSRAFYGFMVALAFVALLGFGLVNEGSSGPEVGDEVPTTELTELGTEEPGSIEDYRGRWVLVNFWASWCDPCREESPDLQALQRRYGGQEFTVLGIDTRDLTQDGVEFVKEFGLTYPQLRDGDGQAAQDWGTTGVPESFLVDPDGVLVEKFPGPVDERIIRERFIPILEREVARQ